MPIKKAPVEHTIPRTKEVWEVDLGNSEPRIRKCVVVSNDVFNTNPVFETIVVIPLSNLLEKGNMVHVNYQPDGMFHCEKVMPISKSRFKERTGEIDEPTYIKILNGLSWLFDATISYDNNKYTKQ